MTDEATLLTGFFYPDFPTHASRRSVDLVFPTRYFGDQKMEHFGHCANLYRGPLRRTDLSHPAQFFGPVRGSDHLRLPDDWARRHHHCREKLEELHAVGWALCDRST